MSNDLTHAPQNNLNRNSLPNSWLLLCGMITVLLSIAVVIDADLGSRLALIVAITIAVIGGIKLLTLPDITVFATFIFLIPYSIRIPISNFPFTVTAILLYILIVRTILIRPTLRIARSILIPLSVLFIMIGVITTFMGIDYANSIRKLYNVINAIIVFWATTHFLVTTQHVQKVMKALIISSIPLALIGIAQVGLAFILGPGLPGANIVADWNKTMMILFEGQKVVDRVTDWSMWWRTTNWFADSFNSLRATGTTWSPMSYAQLLMFSFFPLLALTLSSAPNKKRGWMLVAVLIQTAAIVLTLSRGAWLVLMVGVLYLGYSFLRGQLRVSRKIFSRIIVIGILAISIGVVATPASTKESIVAAVLSIVQPESDVRQFNSSNESRFLTYSLGLEIIQENWLFGVGPGNYAVYWGGEDGATSHNLYLDVASEMGLFGLAIYLSIFIITFYNFSYVARKNIDPHIKAISIGFNTTLIALLFYWMFTSYFFEPKINMMLWFMIGLSVVLKRITKRALYDQRRSLNTLTN